jgi:hypothetical protein
MTGTVWFITDYLDSLCKLILGFLWYIRQALYSCVTCSLCQGCGSGSGLDPDSVTLWIRIRIGNPDPGARKLRNFSGKNLLFSYFFKKLYH